MSLRRRVPLEGVGPPSHPFQGYALPLSYKGNRKAAQNNHKDVWLFTGRLSKVPSLHYVSTITNYLCLRNLI